MPLSRRQFFRRFINSNDRTGQDRINRYAVLESYVRTHLLPYDFTVTEYQCSELMAEVRANLEAMTDENLFTAEAYRLVDTIANAKIQPWREAYWLQEDDRYTPPRDLAGN